MTLCLYLIDSSIVDELGQKIICSVCFLLVVSFVLINYKFVY